LPAERDAFDARRDGVSLSRRKVREKVALGKDRAQSGHR